MQINQTRMGLAGALFLAACAGSALGQSVTYLTPEKYQAEAGQALNVFLETDGSATDAAAGAPKNQPSALRRTAWPVERVDWLFARNAGFQENLETVPVAGAGNERIALTFKHPGGAVVGADLRPVIVEMTGKDLQAFFQQRVTADSLPADAKALKPEQKYRVKRIESAKAVLRVRGADGQVPPDAMAISKTGQVVEMRLLVDPTQAVTIGSDVPLWTYVHGAKKGNVKLRITNVGGGTVRELQTDGGATCNFRLTNAGVWRIEFHYAEPLKNDPNADWVIYSATLTFEAAAGAGK